MKSKKIKNPDQRKSKKNIGRIEDLIDVQIAEPRKDEKKIPWETAKRQLRKLGKL